MIGVATQSMAVETILFENELEAIDFVPAAGSIAPNGHLVIITDGLAPAVNVSSLTTAAEWSIGHKLSLSMEGDLVRAGGASASAAAAGVDSVTADAIEIGKVASPVDEASGTVALFVDID